VRGEERSGASKIGRKRVEGVAHRVRGLMAVSASIPAASMGSGDRAWTRGSGEECRGRGVSHLAGKTWQERERKWGGD
jgi:hypothetical protein